MKIKPYNIRLRSRSSMARGLIGAWVAMPGQSQGYRDYGPAKRNATWAAGWTATPTIGPYGSAFIFDGANNHFATTPTLALSPAAGTVLMVFQAPPAGSTVDLLSNSTGANAQHFGLVIQNNPLLRLDTNNGSSAVVLRSTVLSSTTWSGAWHTAVARYGPLGTYLWCDGTLLASGAAPSGFALPANDYLTIGGRLSFGYTGQIDSAFAFSRELSDTEIAKWSADPWWGFRPKRPPRFIPSPIHFRRNPFPGRIGSRSVA
jgi:hypothetical protein